MPEEKSRKKPGTPFNGSRKTAELRKLERKTEIAKRVAANLARRSLATLAAVYRGQRLATNAAATAAAAATATTSTRREQNDDGGGGSTCPRRSTAHTTQPLDRSLSHTFSLTLLRTSFPLHTLRRPHRRTQSPILFSPGYSTDNTTTTDVRTNSSTTDNRQTFFVFLLF